MADLYVLSHFCYKVIRGNEQGGWFSQYAVTELTRQPAVRPLCAILIQCLRTATQEKVMLSSGLMYGQGNTTFLRSVFRLVALSVAVRCIRFGVLCVALSLYKYDVWGVPSVALHCNVVCVAHYSTKKHSILLECTTVTTLITQPSGTTLKRLEKRHW